MAVWDTAYKNNLPDSSFAYIEPGGEKDEDGKTTPRTLRHFPYKTADGKVDPAHVRDALGRIPQSDVGSGAKASALAKMKKAAASLGIGDYSEEYLLADGRPVMVFPIGKFKTGKYPKLNLSRDFAQQVVDNFDRGVLGATEPFVDVSGKHDPASPAGAWVKSLFIAPWKGGEALYAQPEWTSEGKRVVGDKLYRYLSPRITSHRIPETGEDVYPVLHSLSLTNVPVLRMMPPVQLSEPELEIACSELQPVFEDESIEVEMDETPDVVVDAPADGTTDVKDQVADAVAEADKKNDDSDVVAELEAMFEKLTTITRNRRGAPAVRNYVRDAIERAKARNVAASEVADIMEEMLTELKSGKELNQMQKLVERYELSEGATEDDVLGAIDAQVAKLTEERVTVETKLSEAETKLAETSEKLAEAETKLAEVAEDKRRVEIEHKLSEAISATTLTAADVGDADNSGWARDLAYADLATFEKMLETRKPQVDLSEMGSGESNEQKTEDVSPDVAYRNAAHKAMSEKDISLTEAYAEVRREQPDLFAAYLEWQKSVIQSS